MARRDLPARPSFMTRFLSTSRAPRRAGSMLSRVVARASIASEFCAIAVGWMFSNMVVVRVAVPSIWHE